MGTLVKFVKLNNLQYNANRDPQVYRRLVGEKFRIQAFIAGSGTAHCALLDPLGAPIIARGVLPPASFDAEVAFDTPGQRLVTLEVTRGAEHFTQILRLDVLERAWIG